MKYSKENMNLEAVLESLKKDFDAELRNEIFQILKDHDFEEDDLTGAKLLLEQNHWDHQKVHQIFAHSQNRIDETLKNHRNNSKLNLSVFIKYAALLLPFLAVTSYYFFDETDSIDQYYVPESGLPNFLEVKKETHWNTLMKLYKQNEFTQAYETVSKINEIKPKNDTAVYFKAVIAYELEQFEVSNDYFQKTLYFQNSIFKYDAAFRLGFSLYKSNDKVGAKKVFQEILSDPNHPFQEEANQIITVFF
jgi:tetratricopeptide (TPR) repeat protein